MFTVAEKIGNSLDWLFSYSFAYSKLTFFVILRTERILRRTKHVVRLWDYRWTCALYTVKLLVKKKKKKQCVSLWPACTFGEIFLGMYLCSCVPSKCLHRTLSIEPIIYPSYQGKFPDKLEPLDRADSLHNGQPLTWKKKNKRKDMGEKGRENKHLVEITTWQDLSRKPITKHDQITHVCVMHLNLLTHSGRGPTAHVVMILFTKELCAQYESQQQIQLMQFQNHYIHPITLQEIILKGVHCWV